MTTAQVSWPSARKSSGANKLLGLELLRFVAAFAVLLWHYQYFCYVGYQAIGFRMEDQPLFSFVKPLYQFGYYGVNVFWCISGFIFFWKYAAAIRFGAIGPAKFAVLRFSRLYPLHFLTLWAMAFLQLTYLAQSGSFFTFEHNDVYDFMLQLFMASSWGLESGPSFNAPIWSVSVELVAYLVFFAGLRYVRRPFLLICIVLTACAAAKAMRLYSPIFDCLMFFFIGGLAAIIKLRLDSSVWSKLMNRAALVWLIVFPLCAAWTNAYSLHAFALVALLLYTPGLLYVLASDYQISPSARKLIEAAGNMTYASYLIHFPLLLGIVILFKAFDTPIPFYNVLFLVFFLGLTLLLSRWTFVYFELPVQNLIRRRFSANRVRMLKDDGIEA